MTMVSLTPFVQILRLTLPRHWHCLLLGFSDVIIAGWEAEMYAVSESDLSLSICATQMARIERDVPVTFSSLPQTAISEYLLWMITLTVDDKCKLLSQMDWTIFMEPLPLSCFHTKWIKGCALTSPLPMTQYLRMTKCFEFSLEVLVWGSVQTLQLLPSLTVTVRTFMLYSHHISKWFFVAVTVRFEETSYEFEEGSIETSNICVVSSGESDIPFTVTLSTLDGTAAGIVDIKSVPKHTYKFFFSISIWWLQSRWWSQPNIWGFRDQKVHGDRFDQWCCPWEWRVFHSYSDIIQRECLHSDQLLYH